MGRRTYLAEDTSDQLTLNVVKQLVPAHKDKDFCKSPSVCLIQKQKLWKNWVDMTKFPVKQLTQAR